MAMRLDGPRADAGQRVQAAARAALRSVPGLEVERAVGEGAGEAERGWRRRVRGSASDRRVERGERGGRREQVGEPAGGVVDRLAVRAATRRAAWVRAAAVETCWPSTARTANSAPSTVRGTRRPGALATSGASSGSCASRPSTAAGSASRSSSRRQRAMAVGQVAQVGEASRQPMCVGVRGDRRHDAVAVREAQGAAVGPVAPLLDAGHGGRREVAEEVVGVERRAERQPQRERARRRPPARPLRPAPAARSGRGEDLPHGVVERADAGEAGGEGDVGHRQVGGLDQQPGGLGALGAGERERARAELGERAGARSGGRCSRGGRRARARPRGRRRRRRSGAWRGPRGRRARSTPASPGWRPGGSRLQARKPACWRPRRSGRKRMLCRLAAARPGSSAGSRCRWSSTAVKNQPSKRGSFACTARHRTSSSTRSSMRPSCVRGPRVSGRNATPRWAS